MPSFVLTSPLWARVCMVRPLRARRQGGASSHQGRVRLPDQGASCYVPRCSDRGLQRPHRQVGHLCSSTCRGSSTGVKLTHGGVVTQDDRTQRHRLRGRGREGRGGQPAGVDLRRGAD